MYDTIASGVTHEVASGALLGFSTRLVVEATADYVRDVVGFAGDRIDARVVGASFFTDAHTEQTLGRHWRLPGPTGPGIHRVRETDTYRLHITGGTLALDVKQARPYGRSAGLAFGLEQLRDKYELERLALGTWWHSQPDALDELADGDEHAARVISEWSPRSRSRMLRALAEIDHDSWVSTDPLALVTLTLPGEWLTVAPDGATFKEMFDRLRRRWWRAIGWWQCAWKLEFQRRGAPHLHLATRPPAEVDGKPFREWLSATWADVVGAKGDEYRRHLAAGTGVDYRTGAASTDSKRMAIYFYKHSAKTADSKEYQHIVPEPWRADGKGPGRFWGVAGLTRTRASVEVHAQVWHQLRRELRKLDRAQNARTALSRRRAMVEDMGETTRRGTLNDLRLFGGRKTRRGTSPMGGFWLILNDAPGTGAVLARWLASRGPVGVSP